MGAPASQSDASRAVRSQASRGELESAVFAYEARSQPLELAWPELLDEAVEAAKFRRTQINEREQMAVCVGAREHGLDLKRRLPIRQGQDERDRRTWAQPDLRRNLDPQRTEIKRRPLPRGADVDGDRHRGQPQAPPTGISDERGGPA